MEDTHRVDVFSDGTVSIVTEGGGIGITVMKDKGGRPVESSVISAADMKKLGKEDMTALRFDRDKQQFKAGRRKIVINLKKKDNGDNDKTISTTTQTNVSADTGRQATQADK